MLAFIPVVLDYGTCAGDALVQADKALLRSGTGGFSWSRCPCYGENQKEEEGEVENEVDGNKEEETLKTPVRMPMTMDEMERH